MSKVPLFRPEAIAALAPSSQGEIVLLPGAGSRWIAFGALAVLAGLAALLFWASYTQRATVSGLLQPATGLIRVVPGSAGVLMERNVREGQDVQRGDVLFVLSSDRSAPGGAGYRDRLASQVSAQKQLLEQERQRTSRDEDAELVQLARREQSLQSELDTLGRQTEAQSQRVAQSQDAVRRYQSLHQQDYVSRDELQARESELAEQQNRLRNLQRERLALERELGANRRDREGSKARYAGQRVELERSILTAQQELTQLDALRRIVVTAPQAGRVSLVRADVGQSIDANEVIAHVVPQGTPLIAQLYVPSRASGFVRAGDRVLLRYDAFPFQRFGMHEGRVIAVSSSAAPRAELGEIAPPDGLTESLFAVQIALPEQAIGGQGNVPRQPLQAGMRVEGDLLQDTRRLYQWVIEPLATAAQKVAPLSQDLQRRTPAAAVEPRPTHAVPAASAP